MRKRNSFFLFGTLVWTGFGPCLCDNPCAGGAEDIPLPVLRLGGDGSDIFAATA